MLKCTQGQSTKYVIKLMYNFRNVPKESESVEKLGELSGIQKTGMKADTI